MVLAILALRKDLSRNPTLEVRFAGKLLLKEQLDAPIRLLIFIGALVLGTTVMVGEKQAEVDGFWDTKSLWFLTKVANVIGSLPCSVNR